jgi:hypothetical protein
MLFLSISHAQTIQVMKLDFAPKIDGIDDWSNIKTTLIYLHKSYPNATTSIKTVKIKVAVFNKYVYFYTEWQDDSHDIIHKLFFL